MKERRVKRKAQPKAFNAEILSKARKSKTESDRNAFKQLKKLCDTTYQEYKTIVLQEWNLQKQEKLQETLEPYQVFITMITKALSKVEL